MSKHSKATAAAIGQVTAVQSPTAPANGATLIVVSGAGATVTPAADTAAPAVTSTGNPVLSDTSTVTGAGTAVRTIVEDVTGSAAADTSTAAAAPAVKLSDAMAAVLAIMTPAQIAGLAATNPAIADYVRAKAAAASPKIAGEIASDKVLAYLSGNAAVVSAIKAAAALLGDGLDKCHGHETKAAELRAAADIEDKAASAIRQSAEFGKYADTIKNTSAAALGTDGENYRVTVRFETAADGIETVLVSAIKKDGHKRQSGSTGSGSKVKGKVTVKVTGADWNFIGTRKEFYAALPSHKAVSDGLPLGCRKLENFTQLTRLIKTAEKTGKYTIAGHDITYVRTLPVTPAAAADTSTSTGK